MNAERRKVSIIKQRKKAVSGLLRDYYLEGCRISLEGKEVQPWQAADTYLREDGCYMMDFIPDSSNKIRNIDLVRIKSDDAEDLIGGSYVGWCS